MSGGRILRIYLDDENIARAKAGQFNIMNKIRLAFEGAGYRVEYTRNAPGQRARAAARRGYGLFYMDEPAHQQGLCLRKAYFYPFWRIEKTMKRWEWDIAKTTFAPESVDARAAAQFYGYWRGRLFPDLGEVARDGFVYMPLQGRLLEHRSFQTQSPLDMIRTTLAYERTRNVVVTLHPRETYLPEERAALKALIDREQRLQLSSEPMERLLARCDYVATQNSSAALSGYFLGKPAVLFAKIDFHHIAANVAELGAERAFAEVVTHAPDFAAYIHWFLKETAINGGSDEVGTQILAAARRQGWLAQR